MEFINNFDQAHDDLGQEVLERIKRKAEAHTSGQNPKIILNGHDLTLSIMGYDEEDQSYFLPRGTKGELKKWKQVSDKNLISNDQPKVEAEVFVLTGPYRGKTLTIDGQFIELVP